MMQITTEPTTVAVLVGVFGLAFGAVAALGKWGIESLKVARERRNGGTPGANSAGFHSIDRGRLNDTKKLAVGIDQVVREMAQNQAHYQEQSLTEERAQTQAMRDLGTGFTALRIELAEGRGRRQD